MAKLVLTTTNPGKLTEVKSYVTGRKLSIHSLQDVELDQLDPPEENGVTHSANARIKVEYYAGMAQVCQVVHEETLIFIADDTALSIRALGGEPGIKVRRWKDGITRMSDEEIIAYTLERMRIWTGEKRRARFSTALAVRAVSPNGQVSDLGCFTGELDGQILEAPRALRVEGKPFASLFYLPELGMTLGEIDQIPIEERGGQLTHREQAMELALLSILGRESGLA